MRFDALRHIRDHAKITGLPRLLLYEIGTHLNYHTGEAFLLSVDRLAHQLGVTPQWTRRLLHTLIASGELIVARSRGRHANVYRIPYERCHACQAVPPQSSTPPEPNPKLEFPVEVNREEINPKLDAPQPETGAMPTGNSPPCNPKLRVVPGGLLARIAPSKDVKERKMSKDAPFARADHHPDVDHHHAPARRRRCGWGSCDQGVCPHEVNFCAAHAHCQACLQRGS
jgi:hypothetical protein